METAHALTEKLAALLRREHDALAEFLVALADFDHRRAWAELGHASLFHFLHRELHLSKGAAHYRKVAAELIQEVPAVAEGLRSGELCLTSIVEAARVVTTENCEAVLPRFYRLSKREAMEVVAAMQPAPTPPVRTVVTAVRSAANRAPSAGPLLAAAEPRQRSGGAPVAPSGWPDEPRATQVPAPRPPELVPLSAEACRLHVTVSTRFARKLAEAKDARPGLTDEELLEAGLDLLLAHVAKRREGAVARPLKKPRPSKPHHVSAHLRREVWKRDGGRCQFMLSNGEPCGCTRDLQIDHIQPLARGGTTTLENLRLTCRPHNLESARRILGAALMDRYVRPRRSADGARSVDANQFIWPTHGE